MHKLTKALAIVAAWPLLAALLLGSIIAVAFSPQVYLRQYDQLGQADVIGCNPTTLENITYHLIAYMAGGDGAPPDLTINALINGERREVFNAKEKQHMADVKYLFDMARYVAVICVIATLLLLVCATILAPPGKKARPISAGILWGMASFALIAGALAIYAMLDFPRFWTAFHQLVFTNDLWLLDPSTDVLIQMMPQRFFENLTTLIALIFLGASAAIALTAGIVRLICLRRDQAMANELADEIAPRVIPSPRDDTVTIIPAADGERLMLTQDQSMPRPDAQQIFDQFGLSDDDDTPLLPDEPATTRPLFKEAAAPPLIPYAPPEPPMPESEAAIEQDTSAEQEITIKEKQAVEPESPQQPESIEMASSPLSHTDDPDETMHSAMEALEGEAAITPSQPPVPAKDVQDDALTLRVPVVIPASALDITRLKDGVKLELKLELFLRDDGTLGPALALANPPAEPANPAQPPIHEAEQAQLIDEEPASIPQPAADGPSIEELLSRMDKIMQDFPTEDGGDE